MYCDFLMFCTHNILGEGSSFTFSLVVGFWGVFLNHNRSPQDKTVSYAVQIVKLHEANCDIGLFKYKARNASFNLSVKKKRKVDLKNKVYSRRRSTRPQFTTDTMCHLTLLFGKNIIRLNQQKTAALWPVRGWVRPLPHLFVHFFTGILFACQPLVVYCGTADCFLRWPRELNRHILKGRCNQYSKLT